MDYYDNDPLSENDGSALPDGMDVSEYYDYCHGDDEVVKDGDSGDIEASYSNDDFS